MDELRRYLDAFHAKALAASLPVRKPGANWVAFDPLAHRSHVSLSVARQRIQVNLNNEDDADRAIYERLHSEREAIEQAIGEGLRWERKDGRRKTAVRATLEEGYEGADQDGQHVWALTMVRRFQDVFVARLGR